MIDKRPRVIAGCATPADVRTALERARADRLDVAIRAGGHSVAGMSTNDDGLVVEFQSLLDDEPGNRHYWSADYHDDLPDEALTVFVRSALEAPSPLTQQIFFAWGGAVARVPEQDTPLTNRGATWVSHPFAVWQDPLDDHANIEWVRRFRRDIAPYANGGVYLNFIGDEGEGRIRKAYGQAKYDRLAQIKATYDPDNLFRGNQNIAPARSVGLAHTGHVEVRNP
ncbi:MAG: BBE domain-containing protein [Nocardioidaceae bacterium]